MLSVIIVETANLDGISMPHERNEFSKAAKRLEEEDRQENRVLPFAKRDP